MKSRPLILLATFGLAAAAFAQEESMPKFADFDANEDGKIDEEEAAALVELFAETDKEFEFATADANDDGAIDAAEYAELMS